MSVPRQPAAERIGQQLLGHRPDEDVRLAQQRLPQLDHAVDRRAVDQLPRGVDRRAARAAVARAPGADGVEVLEREPDRVDHPVAAGARRVAAVLLQALAHRPRLGAPRCPPRTAARRRAAAAAARRARSRAPTCRAAPATCGARARSPSGWRPCRAGRAARRRSASRGGSGCRRRWGCRSAAPAAR